jgi:hypothetical protein
MATVAVKRLSFITSRMHNIAEAIAERIQQMRFGGRLRRSVEKV